MPTILERIHKGEILLSDGAMGTELQKRGLLGGACPEELNISHPEIIQSIYKDYYEAGSDIVETNTFGGTRPRLALHQNEDRVALFNRRAAELARSACPPGRFVAGSMGPTGELLQPLGTLSAARAYDYFAEQAEALAEGGVDIIYVETMMAAEEAAIAVRAAKEKTGLPVSGSMTFELNTERPRTSWGVDVPSAVTQLTDAGADIIGSNCGNGVEVILAVIKEMRPLTRLPILAQPNAGLPEVHNNLIIYNETPESMEAKLAQVLKIGISILGGCCGTNPQHIRRMRHLINRFNTR